MFAARRLELGADRVPGRGRVGDATRAAEYDFGALGCRRFAGRAYPEDAVVDVDVHSGRRVED